MRRPTRLTPVLQVALPAYFVVMVLLGWVELAPTIVTSLEAGRQFRATVLISSRLLWSGLVAVTAYGRARRWRWVFWLYLVLLALLIVTGFGSPHPTPVALIYDLVGGLIDAALLTVSIFGAIRYGPWAMMKT